MLAPSSVRVRRRLAHPGRSMLFVVNGRGTGQRLVTRDRRVALREHEVGLDDGRALLNGDAVPARVRYAAVMGT